MTDPRRLFGPDSSSTTDKPVYRCVLEPCRHERDNVGRVSAPASVTKFSAHLVAKHGYTNGPLPSQVTAPNTETIDLIDSGDAGAGNTAAGATSSTPKPQRVAKRPRPTPPPSLLRKDAGVSTPPAKTQAVGDTTPVRREISSVKSVETEKIDDSAGDESDGSLEETGEGRGIRRPVRENWTPPVPKRGTLIRSFCAHTGTSAEEVEVLLASVRDAEERFE